MFVTSVYPRIAKIIKYKDMFETTVNPNTTMTSSKNLSSKYALISNLRATNDLSSDDYDNVFINRVNNQTSGFYSNLQSNTSNSIVVSSKELAGGQSKYIDDTIYSTTPKSAFVNESVHTCRRLKRKRLHAIADETFTMYNTCVDEINNRFNQSNEIQEFNTEFDAESLSQNIVQHFPLKVFKV